MQYEYDEFFKFIQNPASLDNLGRILPILWGITSYEKHNPMDHKTLPFIEFLMKESVKSGNEESFDLLVDFIEKYNKFLLDCIVTETEVPEITLWIISGTQ